MGGPMDGSMKTAVALGLLAVACVFVYHAEMDAHAEEHIAQSTATVDAMAAGRSVKGAVLDLKAFCVGAHGKARRLVRKANQGRTSVIPEFIFTFGKNRKERNAVSEYAKIMGTMMSKHRTGLGHYLLNAMNYSVVSGRGVVVVKTALDAGRGQSRGAYAMLDHKALALRTKPRLLRVLGVRLSTFAVEKTRQSARNQHANGDAAAAWLGNGGKGAYHTFSDKIQAQWNRLDALETRKEEEGAFKAEGIAWRGAAKRRYDHLRQVTVQPPAGAVGGAMVRKRSSFYMPSPAAIKKQAMERSAKWLVKMRHRRWTPDRVINRIEAKIEGVTVRMTTAPHKNAGSGTSPRIAIVGSMGTLKGRIKALPLRGKTIMQTFTGKYIGRVKRVLLSATGTDGWLIKHLAVRVGRTGAWTKVCRGNFWLKGRKKPSWHQGKKTVGASSAAVPSKLELDQASSGWGRRRRSRRRRSNYRRRRTMNWVERRAKAAVRRERLAKTAAERRTKAVRREILAKAAVHRERRAKGAVREKKSKEQRAKAAHKRRKERGAKERAAKRQALERRNKERNAKKKERAAKIAVKYARERSAKAKARAARTRFRQVKRCTHWGWMVKKCTHWQRTASLVGTKASAEDSAQAGWGRRRRSRRYNYRRRRYNYRRRRYNYRRRRTVVAKHRHTVKCRRYHWVRQVVASAPAMQLDQAATGWGRRRRSRRYNYRRRRYNYRRRRYNYRRRRYNYRRRRAPRVNRHHVFARKRVCLRYKSRHRQALEHRRKALNKKKRLAHERLKKAAASKAAHIARERASKERRAKKAAALARKREKHAKAAHKRTKIQQERRRKEIVAKKKAAERQSKETSAKRQERSAKREAHLRRVKKATKRERFAKKAAKARATARRREHAAKAAHRAERRTKHIMRERSTKEKGAKKKKLKQQLEKERVSKEKSAKRKAASAAKKERVAKAKAHAAAVAAAAAAKKAEAARRKRNAYRERHSKYRPVVRKLRNFYGFPRRSKWSLHVDCKHKRSVARRHRKRCHMKVRTIHNVTVKATGNRPSRPFKLNFKTLHSVKFRNKSGNTISCSGKGTGNMSPFGCGQDLLGMFLTTAGSRKTSKLVLPSPAVKGVKRMGSKQWYKLKNYGNKASTMTWKMKQRVALKGNFRLWYSEDLSNKAKWYNGGSGFTTLDVSFRGQVCK